MENPDRPNLGPLVYEQIELGWHEIDKRYWKSLREMQVITEAAEEIFHLRRDEPREPKRPEHLRNILRTYAQELFYAEALNYPDDTRLPQWLFHLAHRVAAKVMETVREIESGKGMSVLHVATASLSYHGLTQSQMIETVVAKLKLLTSEPLPSTRHQYPVSRPNTSASKPSVSAPSSASADSKPDSEIERRQKLLEEYRRATNTSNKRLYEAKNSGIHKPQFYEWINGTLPATSVTAQNFERFLREKKLPTPRKPKI